MKTADWTFGQRIDTICEVMRLCKGRCDKLMKGGELVLYVANPAEILSTSKTNRTQNDKRQVFLGEGRRVLGQRVQTSGRWISILVTEVPLMQSTGTRRKAAPRARGGRSATATSAATTTSVSTGASFGTGASIGLSQRRGSSPELLSHWIIRSRAHRYELERKAHSR
jgi:hypothetical protein